MYFKTVVHLVELPEELPEKEEKPRPPRSLYPSKIEKIVDGQVVFTLPNIHY